MSEKITRTRTCDHCGADLTVTDKSYGWHYSLKGEWTPSTSMIGYDPHPEPPEAAHFCDKECLARWTDNSFGNDLRHGMVDAGRQVLADAGVGGAVDYVSQSKLARKVFDAMWRARDTAGGKLEREADAETKAQ